MMIHESERRAFLAGAEAMRQACAATVLLAARDTQLTAEDCRQTRDCELLMIEAKTLRDLAEQLSGASVPDFIEWLRAKEDAKVRP